MKELEEKMQDLCQKMAILSKGNLEDDEFGEESPFSREIQVETLPLDFEEPHMTPYDGTTDPKHHLRAFNELMKMKKVSCKVMSDYDMLITSVTNVKQREQESLQRYIQHFNTEVAKVGRMFEDKLKFAITTGLCLGSRLCGNMLKRELDGIEDFYERVKKYIHMEEGNRVLEMDTTSMLKVESLNMPEGKALEMLHGRPLDHSMRKVIRPWIEEGHSAMA
uniref:Retrotransposon gag domain-containing protein n=1 Tax=Cannabis sativa TaxID=3483 RepID=A0A803P561_CANSA